MRFPDAFNPYSDVCQVHDVPTAPEIRRRNLQAILEAVGDRPVDELWLGLEPTWRGGRRTGLAITDDPRLALHASRWRAAGVTRATRSEGPYEQTAENVWKALAGVSERVFLWNAVPLHTHKPGLPLSDRRHTKTERNACLPLLGKLLDLLHCNRRGREARVRRR